MAEMTSRRRITDPDDQASARGHGCAEFDAMCRVAASASWVMALVSSVVSIRSSPLGNLVDDDILNTFVVVGEIGAAGVALRERFTGLVDRVAISMPYEADDMLALDVVTAGE
jgi:hypothetical protein